MKKLYQELINGTFKPNLDPEKPVKDLLLLNYTNVPVQPKLWSDIALGGHTKWPLIRPMQTLDIRARFPNWAGTIVGDVVIFTSVATGSFISAAIITPLVSDIDGYEVSVLPNSELDLLTALKKFPDIGANFRDLVSPNDIGEPPAPTAQILIPSDSPRICVGIAARQPDQPGSWSVLVHEQYWKRHPSSFSLAPQSSRLVSTSHTSGRIETSSSEKSVSEALGTNISAGWGPISASISASLNKSEVTSRSVSLSESESIALQETYDNKTDSNEVILFWNLVDVYTWLSVAGESTTQLAVVELLQAPMLVRRYLHPNSTTN